ncbi:MAG: hypothetical protein AAB847_00435 [Patescibacteria group bacterium]
MIIIWKAPEYHYHEKDVSWYWLVIILAIIITAIALWQRNFLFAVFTVIAGITLLVWGHRKPSLIDFELNEHGLKIGDVFYPKDLFDNFSLNKNGSEWDKLLLKKKSKISNILTIPTPQSEFDNIKKYCLNFWTEAELKESMIDDISNLLKF